jgi:hypothetical protein
MVINILLVAPARGHCREPGHLVLHQGWATASPDGALLRVESAHSSWRVGAALALGGKWALDGAGGAAGQ